MTAHCRRKAAISLRSQSMVVNGGIHMRSCHCALAASSPFPPPYGHGRIAYVLLCGVCACVWRMAGVSCVFVCGNLAGLRFGKGAKESFGFVSTTSSPQAYVLCAELLCTAGNDTVAKTAAPIE